MIVPIDTRPLARLNANLFNLVIRFCEAQIVDGVLDLLVFLSS